MDEPTLEGATRTSTRPADSPDGLSSAEAARRLRRGEGNTAPARGSRSYAVILRSNLFSFFTIVLYVIGGALLALGRINDAIVSVGLGVITAAIGAVQEMRAKSRLDKLHLLSRSTVHVVRDGRDVEIAPEQVVRGDVVRVDVGEQIVVDGPLLPGGRVEMDESLLTGESEPVPKEPGDDLLSASVCVRGVGFQVAREVGPASHANRLTEQARRESNDATPLQRRMALVVRVVIVLVTLMSATILLQAALEGFSLTRVVQTTAVLSGLVPYGLFFLIAVAYTVGAVKAAAEGALVQRVNAVESVSNVDVVCTDKTGTLTTGRLGLAELRPVGPLEQSAVELLLGSVARSSAAPNLTSTALAAALPGRPLAVVEDVPFTSSLRWSAVRTDDEVYVLGAPDALADHLVGSPLTGTVGELAARGLRVLVFARARERTSSLRGGDGRPRLPALEPLAVVALADELRPHVGDTVARFLREGTAVKILSGDDPATVAALATQAGIEAGEPVRGTDLDALTDAELDAVVARATVFGRIAPEQKERIVLSLRRQGHYVAMIGDGVNDAQALKRAQVGVAMRSGSPVARDVADIVLTDDSFAALLPAQLHGRRIINGIVLSMQVFLARVTTQGLVIVAVTMLGLGFPYSPTQVGLTLLTVGVPTLFLTMWARPSAPDPHMFVTLARFVLPAGVVTAAGGVAVYAYLYTMVSRGLSNSTAPAEVIRQFEGYTGLSYADAGFTEAAATIGAQTGLSTFVTLAAFGLILFLEPPHRIFASWTTTSPDKRPAVLVGGLVVAFAAVLFTPALSDYFGLTGPAQPVFTSVLPTLAVWFLVLTAVYRFRLLDRILGLPAATAEASG